MKLTPPCESVVLGEPPVRCPCFSIDVYRNAELRMNQATWRSRASEPDQIVERIALDLEDDLRREGELIEAQLKDARRVQRAAALAKREQVLSSIDDRVAALEQRCDEIAAALALLVGSDEPVPSEEVPAVTTAVELSTPAAAAEVSAPMAAAEVSVPSVKGSSGPAPQATEAPKAKSKGKPQWAPRPISELDHDLESMPQALAKLGTDERDLAEFKAQCCFFQRAYQERQRHPGSQDVWHQQAAALRELQRERWANRYCIPLGPEVRLDPPDWLALGERYLALGSAASALDWVLEVLPEQPAVWVQKDAQPVLEAIAAASARLYSWLQAHLPLQHDDQQRELYASLRDLGQRHRMFLRLLSSSETVRDAEIDSVSVEVNSRWEALQIASARRVKQAQALAQFHSLLTREDFGTRDDDDEHLCAAAVNCLDAGIPATDKRLRDRLLGFLWMIEDDERLSKLSAAVATALAKSKDSTGSETPTDERADDLPPDLQQKLQELIPHTEGRRGLIVGGICRDESRRSLEQAFRFSELRWPSTDPSDPFEKSRREIERADWVFLTRFNRKHSREAVRICRESGKPLVRLPKGYGLHEVVLQAYTQRFQRVQEEAG